MSRPALVSILIAVAVVIVAIAVLAWSALHAPEEPVTTVTEWKADGRAAYAALGYEVKHRGRTGDAFRWPRRAPIPTWELKGTVRENFRRMLEGGPDYRG